MGLGRNEVYHNGCKAIWEEMLHNSLRYVNKCNQIYKVLCYLTKRKRIFGGVVNIKLKEYLCKKLLLFGV